MNVPASRVRSRSGRTVGAYLNKNVSKELRAGTHVMARAGLELDRPDGEYPAGADGNPATVCPDGSVIGMDTRADGAEELPRLQVQAGFPATCRTSSRRLTRFPSPVIRR